MSPARKHLAFLLTLAPLVGCSNAPAEEPEPDVAVHTGAETAASPAGPTLALLDAGAEPRQALRYSFEPGQRGELRIDLAMTLSSLIGDLAAEVDAAPTRFVFQVGPVQVLEGGRYSYEVGISDLEVTLEEDLDEETAALVRETLQPLTTLAGWFEIDVQGMVQRASFDIPAEMSPRTRTALGNIWTALVTVPLPTEEVGLGARWQLERTVDLPNLSVRQTTTYTIAALTEEGMDLQVTVRQTADPQPMRGLGEGESGQVEVFEATGLGRVSVDLTRLSPVGQVDLTSDVQGSLTADGETVPVRIQMRTVVRTGAPD